MSSLAVDAGGRDGDEQLSGQQWAQVVMVAGIGTVLEWFDFFCYTQLSTVIDRVFFPAHNENIQALAFWGVYAAAFVVRPLGGIIFGHISDTIGRNHGLLISIVFMALSTIAIGSLPTYDIGPYHAGPVASALLAVLRLVQGLAMGGEFGSAVIYVSELASPKRRGLFVALLQLSAHTGMILATLLVMLLENTISDEAMHVWGWRIPFLCAFAAAMLGAFLRRGMPEPHAFLAAARAEKERQQQRRELAADSGADMEVEIVSPRAEKPEVSRIKSQESLKEEAEVPHGVLEALHGHHAGKTPISRLVKNNWMGLLLQICFMAWTSGAFYTMTSWLAKDLPHYGYSTMQTQGITIVSLLCNAAGLVMVGAGFDFGLRALCANSVTVVAGAALGFATFKGVAGSLAAAWGCTCLLHFFVGCGMACLGLPLTRIYEPLERTTGYSFGYNCGYGILGGMSPLAVSALVAVLPPAAHAFAPAIWLTVLAALSVLGVLGLRLYAPGLNRRHIGKME